MELLITNIIKSLIFPPGIFLLLLAAGILILNRSPVIGKSVLWIGIIFFYLVSTPIISSLLINQLETYPALDVEKLEHHAAGAIVVLSSERAKDAKEYGGDTVGLNTLLRTRYGAFLQRKTGLPILVSGGFVLDNVGKSAAQTMAETLKQDFHAGEVWLEEASRTTGENAFFSQKLLAHKQIDTVFLVTQAWHMPRSVAVFENTGLKVIPAPTGFKGGNPIDFSGLLASANAINTSRFALYEMVGFLWYKFRYL